MIVYNDPVVGFASEYLKCPFYNAKGIGFIQDGKWLGAVVFDTYQTTASGDPLSMEASVVILDKKCATRHNIRKLLEFPFADAKVKRLQLRCGRYETQKRRLVERMGFTFEGILREAWPFGGDCAMYSLLKSEWQNGKFSVTSRSARSECYRQSADRLKSADGALSSRA